MRLKLLDVCMWKSVCVEGGQGWRYGFQGPGKAEVKGESPGVGEQISR